MNILISHNEFKEKAMNLYGSGYDEIDIDKHIEDMDNRISEIEDKIGNLWLDEFGKGCSMILGLGLSTHDYFYIMWDGRELWGESPLSRIIDLEDELSLESYKILNENFSRNSYPGSVMRKQLKEKWQNDKNIIIYFSVPDWIDDED